MGIRVTPGVTSVHINGGTVAGFVHGILIDAQSSVSRVTVRDNCRLGVVPGSGTLLQQNVIAGNGLDGVALVGALGDTIRSNTITGNPGATARAAVRWRRRACHRRQRLHREWSG